MPVRRSLSAVPAASGPSPLVLAERRRLAKQTVDSVRRATSGVGEEVYATLVVNTKGTDYFPGLLALASSLADTGTSRPLLVMLVGTKSPALARAEARLCWSAQ